MGTKSEISGTQKLRFRLKNIKKNGLSQAKAAF